MSKFNLPKQREDTIAAACAWIAQLETGELSKADVEAFREWLDSDPDHAIELKRLALISNDLNILSELSEPLKKAARHYDPVLRNSRQKPKLFSLRWFQRPALAASLLLTAVVLVSSLFLSDALQPSYEPIALSTAVGGYLERELEDGSIIKLNTNTSLTIKYQKNQRDIYLLHGEAHFLVAHDADRPFVVHSGEREILAVGTAFVVHMSDQNIRVLVTEGRVAISQDTVKPKASDLIITASLNSSDSSGAIDPAATPKQIPRAPILLSAGQTFADSTQPGTTPIETIIEEELDRRLAWQRGLFEFSETPLFEVIQEVGRYTHLAINISDENLRQLKFDGIFPTGQPELLLDTLATSFGVSVTYVNDSTVVLAFVEPESK